MDGHCKMQVESRENPEAPQGDEERIRHGKVQGVGNIGARSRCPMPQSFTESTPAAEQ